MGNEQGKRLILLPALWSAATWRRDGRQAERRAGFAGSVRQIRSRGRCRAAHAAPRRQVSRAVMLRLGMRRKVSSLLRLLGERPRLRHVESNDPRGG